MSETALYNTLRKILEVSDDEAKEAVADVASAKDVATRADIARAELKYMRWVPSLLFILNVVVLVKLFF